MNLEFENLDDYLLSDPAVDWQTPDVRQTALDWLDLPTAF